MTQKPARHSKDSFSPTEVGTLVEGFRHDVGIIAEKVDRLSNKVDKLDNRFSSVEARLTSVEDAVRIALPNLSRRVEKLEIKVGV